MRTFRERLRRLLKPPRTLRFTRFGAAFTFMTVGMGLAAMNTGNNLVYLVFGMMLGFITASGVVSELCLRNLEAGWLLPAESFAGAPAVARLVVRNGGRKTPSLGIRASARAEGKGLPGMSFEARFILIPAGSSSRADLEFVPKRRGEYALRGVRFETEFPFGFFVKGVELEPGDAGTILAYPALRPIREPRRSPAAGDKGKPRHLAGQGDSFREIRDFFHGDNPRHISWKSTARFSKLMVRETEREAERRTLLVMGREEDWSGLPTDELEEAVSFAASLFRKRMGEGYAAGFFGPGIRLEPSRAPDQAARVLAYLARFEPRNGREDPDDESVLVEIGRRSREETEDILEQWRASR